MKIKAVYLALALVLLFSLVAAVIMPVNPAQAATITVTNTDDSGVGSLRWAIGNATAGDEIDFDVTGTITLTSGHLTINKSLTITGPGEANLAISGNDNSRVFYINNSTVDMSDMTIRNGNTTADGGGVYNDNGNVTITNCTVSNNYAEDNGGGINNDGTLTLTNCTVSGNHNWKMDGGGIYNDNTLTLTNCIVSGNYADDDDGGGINNNMGNVTLTNCTISDNYAADDGGGIRNNMGNVTITNCTISGNNAIENGGGIYNYADMVDPLTMTGCTISGNHATGNGSGVYNAAGNVTMTNCTVSGNTADDDGGGIFNTYSNVLSLTNCTVSGNDAADQGGGIFNDYMTMTMKCTIVYNNTASSDQNIYGYYPSTGENIVDSPDPLLGPLQDNGGTTETHALMTGSPAIDACTTDCPLPATDQRGLPRPADGDIDGTYFCDIGAYEKQVTVGGIVEPVDRIGILAPWLGLAALIVVAMAAIVLVKRKHVA